jgi:carbamoyltransferase
LDKKDNIYIFNNMMNRYILGLSFFYHNSAAVLLKDGVLVAAAEEERFSRIKFDDAFPRQAIKYVLDEAGIKKEDIDYIAFYEKPFLHFERIISTFIDTWPGGLGSFLQAVPLWLKNKMWVKSLFREEFGSKPKVVFIDHHLSHAASTFFCSPFDKAAILTMDGVGEWATTTYGAGDGIDINLKKQIAFPDSLGLLYSAITYYLGFKPNSDEYKVMGLSPYGKPAYIEEIKKTIIQYPDGSYSLDQDYFGHHLSLDILDKRLSKLFNRPRRKPETKLTQFHKDIAKSLQTVLEESVLAIADHIFNETRLENLCLAGGVALNCVSNSHILKQSKFKNIFVQPASGDSGGALGAALYLEHTILRKPRKSNLRHVYLGPSYTDNEIKAFLDEKRFPYQALPSEKLASIVAGLIADNNVIGWFQGRMEFGPRALGNRSIVADPRNKENWQKVNLKIKFRESFRPFAPSVLNENASEYFSIGIPSPYMLFVSDVIKDNIPAVTHVDKTARIQTVDKEINPLYYELIKAFHTKTGCPVLINTSFNVRSEPIVCSPEDAFRCFMKTEMDYLVLGSFLLDKSKMFPIFND